MAGTEPSAERTELVLAAMRSVRSFGDAHDRMSGGMKHGMQMNTTDLAALRLLIIKEDHGKQVSPTDIARHLRISSASTTKLLDRLSESGHVVREQHETDRRARVIGLTQEARMAFFQMFGPKLAAMSAAFEEFSDDELRAAMRVMDAVGAAIDPGEN